MALRRTLRAFVVVLVCTLAVEGQAAEKPTRIKDLRPNAEATIKARVGQRVEAEEGPGAYVFTLRDDFGDMALGRTSRDIRGLRFGATYYVRGRLGENSHSGHPFLDVVAWRPAYGVPISYLIIPAGVALAAALIVLLVTSRRVRAVVPATAWDQAEIVSGPDQGKLFSLRGPRVVVGRKQDPASAVSIVLDGHVSRQHGVLIRDRNATFYEDTNSRGGSWVHEQRVNPRQRVPLPPGALVRLGPHTVLRVGKAPEEDFPTREFDAAQLGEYQAEAPTRADLAGPFGP